MNKLFQSNVQLCLNLYIRIFIADTSEFAMFRIRQSLMLEGIIIEMALLVPSPSWSWNFSCILIFFLRLFSFFGLHFYYWSTSRNTEIYIFFSENMYIGRIYFIILEVLNRNVRRTDTKISITVGIHSSSMSVFGSETTCFPVARNVLKYSYGRTKNRHISQWMARLIYCRRNPFL